MASPVELDLKEDFLGGENGAVTVDWVVLAAAVIGMGMLFLAPIATGSANVASLIGLRIANVEVGGQSNNDD